MAHAEHGIERKTQRIPDKVGNGIVEDEEASIVSINFISIDI